MVNKIAEINDRKNRFVTSGSEVQSKLIKMNMAARRLRQKAKERELQI